MFVIHVREGKPKINNNHPDAKTSLELILIKQLDVNSTRCQCCAGVSITPLTIKFWFNFACTLLMKKQSPSKTVLIFVCVCTHGCIQYCLSADLHPHGCCKCEPSFLRARRWTTGDSEIIYYSTEFTEQENRIFCRGLYRLPLEQEALKSIRAIHNAVRLHEFAA